MSYEFNRVRTTASDAQVKLKLVQELTCFIGRGLEKFGHPPSQLRWQAISNTIQAILADSMLTGVVERLTAPALHERVLEAFFTEYDANCRLYLKEIVVPVAMTRFGEESAIIAHRYSAEVSHLEPAPTLDGALDMAWLNLRRAQQRWIVWMCLGSMLHNTPQGRARDGVEFGDFDAVSKVLMGELHRSEKRMLMFALLKGGEAAETARAWLLATTLCEGMSVMEYLEYDTQLPSRWRVADEEAFRASLSGNP